MPRAQCTPFYFYRARLTRRSHAVRAQKNPRNLLSDPTAELGDLEFTNMTPEAERVIYYDFEPRIDDCPLLLRAPHDFKIEAMHRAEEAAKREKEQRFAARRQDSH